MTIYLDTQKIMDDIRVKSRLAVAGIADPEARYRAEIGTEKMKEIKAAMSTAYASLVTLVERFLEPDCRCTEWDDTDEFPDAVRLDLQLSQRRSGAKPIALTSSFHDYMVQATMAAVYASGSQADLSAACSNNATGVAQKIVTLLYSKRNPYITSY